MYAAYREISETAASLELNSVLHDLEYVIDVHVTFALHQYLVPPNQNACFHFHETNHFEQNLHWKRQKNMHENTFIWPGKYKSTVDQLFARSHVKYAAKTYK